ncbi:MAG: molybdopterin converting factor subunit 1 [Pseudomonadota bacterium]
MRVLYFAWLRERIGASSEDIDVSQASTARDLVALLKEKSDGHALAFDDVDAIRVAVDQEMGTLDSLITDAHEVAFFPPVTGG